MNFFLQISLKSAPSKINYFNTKTPNHADLFALLISRFYRMDFDDLTRFVSNLHTLNADVSERISVEFADNSSL